MLERDHQFQQCQVEQGCVQGFCQMVQGFNGIARFGGLNLLALPTKANDIVFGFIIGFSSLMDFGPEVVGLFLYEDFFER